MREEGRKEEVKSTITIGVEIEKKKRSETRDEGKILNKEQAIGDKVAKTW